MSSTFALWLAIFIVLAVIIGIGAGVLAWMGGLKPPTAILTGGAAFSGTVLLFIAAAEFVNSSV